MAEVEALPEGFRRLGAFHLGLGGQLCADTQGGNWPGLIVLAGPERVLWLSMTERFVDERLRDVERGHPSRKTQERIKREILTALRRGETIQIYAMPCAPVEQPEIKFRLIRELDPSWNIQGRD